MTTVAEIVDPWLNGDPCEGCTKCDKLCLKLKERIESVLAEKDKEIEDYRAVLYRIAPHDIQGWVHSVLFRYTKEDK